MNARRVIGFACALLAGLGLLCGCTTQQRIKKLQQDEAVYSVERSERHSNDQCSQTAIPGSMEHLECRLAKSPDTGAGAGTGK